MQFFHESSSLQVNSVDQIYGKYFPPAIFKNCLACHTPTASIENERLTVVNGNPLDKLNNAPQNQINLFCEIYGVFGNLTKRFANRMDDFQVECDVGCFVPENYLLRKFPIDTLVAISEEPDFWRGVPKYPWAWSMFSELFTVCDGNVYMLADWEFGEQLSDRYIWVKKNFGTEQAERLIFTCDKNRTLLPKSQRDFLIDGDLSNIENWTKAGGSAFYWPEMHWLCPDRAKILAKRIILIKDVVNTLKK